MKYPRAGQAWAWQWVFPSPTVSRDPQTNIVRRHYLYPERLQRALKRAVAQAGIAKTVSVHTLRHYLPFLTMSCKLAGGRHYHSKWRVFRTDLFNQLQDIVFPPTDCSKRQEAGLRDDSARACRAAAMIF
jgi:hypothetical protein